MSKKRFNLTSEVVLYLVFWIMVLVGISVWLFGCASFTAGDISYLRIGNQAIDCTITTHTDGTMVVDFRQNSKTEAMKVLVDALSSYANK